jgi:hypothetical protein
MTVYARTQLSGLGTTYTRRRLAGVNYALADTTAGEDVPATVELGRPYGLATLYAAYPLATLIGLLATGWAGGYFTWLFFGRRKR